MKNKIFHLFTSVDKWKIVFSCKNINRATVFAENTVFIHLQWKVVHNCEQMLALQI